MMSLSLAADNTTTWPETTLYLGALLLGTVLIIAVIASYVELRQSKIAAAQSDDVRQLVRRYEQLAENTLDAQQRVAADLSELRSRTATIEQILRTVE
jgi:hypothetical protein